MQAHAIHDYKLWQMKWNQMKSNTIYNKTLQNTINAINTQ